MTSLAPTNPLFPEILALHGKERAADPALVADGKIVSWAEFDAGTNRVAHGLRALGLGIGDRVAVVMSNSLEMVEVLFGIVKAGCCSVPLNLSVTDEAMANMIGDSGARALFASPDQVERIDGFEAELPAEVCANRILVNETRSGWTTYAALRDAHSTDALNITIPPETPLNIIYSSGTTGMPKGIIATQLGRRIWAKDLASPLRVHRDARTLIATGLYSNISWATMLATLLAGGTLVIGPNRFDATGTLRRIQQERITHTALVPVQFQRMMEAEGQESFDLTSMECAITVGSPMHEMLKEAVHTRLDGALFEIYGLTEGLITVMDGADMPGCWAAVGRPIPGSEIAILGEGDQVLSDGQAGEIVGCAPFVMPGYHNREEATKEALWIDEDGRTWLRTGDIGYFDAEGFLYIVDRKKDMILSGGQNIYPADIEAVLLSHPDVSEAAVIGVPSHRWGETPLGLVVPVAGMAPDPDAIRDAVNAGLGKQQRLAGVELIVEMPRNPNGKILKRTLRDERKDQVYD